MNKITICDKEYEISCNAFTRFEYKKIFGVGIFEDIQKLNTFTQEQESLRKKLQAEGLEEAEIEERINGQMMNKVDDFLDVLERIAYILIYTANKEVGSFEEWLKSIAKIDLSADWIKVVTEFAVNSFC